MKIQQKKNSKWKNELKKKLYWEEILASFLVWYFVFFCSFLGINSRQNWSRMSGKICKLLAIRTAINCTDSNYLVFPTFLLCHEATMKSRFLSLFASLGLWCLIANYKVFDRGKKGGNDCRMNKTKSIPIWKTYFFYKVIRW